MVTPRAIVTAAATKTVAKHRHYVALWVDDPKFDGTQHCSDAPLEYFYPSTETEGGGIRSSARIAAEYGYTRDTYCDSCPFLTACGEYAIAHERFGMWGGMSPSQRKAVRTDRQQVLVERAEIDTVFTPSNIEAYAPPTGSHGNMTRKEATA